MLAEPLAGGDCFRSPNSFDELSDEACHALFRRLATRCFVVQVLERDVDGHWRELHRGGSIEALSTREAPAQEASPLQFLAWLAKQHENRVGAALEEVAMGSSATWRGHAHAHTPGAVPKGIDIEIHRESTRTSSTFCTIIVTESGHEQTLAVPKDNFRERVNLVEAALELGIIEYDAETDLLQLDEAAAALHGLTGGSAGATGLDTWLALLSPDDEPLARKLFTSSHPTGQTERMTVRLTVAESKQPRVIELSLRAVAEGRRLVGACRDVTRERSLEELRRKKLAAERASQAKSEFMSHVSHELRTPLNAILGFAQLMAMDQHHPLNNAHLERLEMVQHSGRRLLGLIDQLLQINKIERGKQTLRIKSVNVRSVVKHCIDALAVMASERGVDIAVDIDRPELSAVRADADALEQALINLLSNAIKYNRDNGRVRITFRATEVGELIVDDTGKGLSESQLGRMFEPFDRLDADKSLVPGTGLGLVITKQLVEAMDGKLDVWSQLGKGSRFKIELPLARGSRATESRNLALEFPSQWDTGRAYSVLYIEDDEVNVVLMEQLFSTQPDWQLRCATTGVEGITAAVRQRPDVILLDMNLPDISGIEVFKKLRADPRTSDIPCVAVSADAVPLHINRVHAMGFEDYWTKPLDLPATISKLKRILR